MVEQIVQNGELNHQLNHPCFSKQNLVHLIALNGRFVLFRGQCESQYYQILLCINILHSLHGFYIICQYAGIVGVPQRRVDYGIMNMMCL